MSIPKEPRQLMINLMYIVLTALLALNVSAEIFNAFKIVNEGLEKSNQVLDQSIEAIPEKIISLSKKSPDLKKYADRVNPTLELAESFNAYLDSLWNTLVTASGGYHEKGHHLEGELVGKKNKDVTTRLLVEEGRGEILREEIIKLRKHYISLVDSADQQEFISQIAINVNDNSWKNKQSTGHQSWSGYHFRQMPLGAIQPMFTKFKNDVKASEYAILNYLNRKVGGEEIILDKFKVVSSPSKTYVIAGEKFNTDIFLSAASSNKSNTAINVKVNGATIPIRDGIAHWSTETNELGPQTYSAQISVKNPVTGEIKTYKKDFEFEVGRRSATVSADKMNVLYVGVDNPISVAVAGVSSNDVKVSATNLSLIQKTEGKFIAQPHSTGKGVITISGGGLQPTNFIYRIKKIPDPFPVLGLGPNRKGGSIKSGVFKAQKRLNLEIPNFDFDAKCKVISYRVVRKPERKDVVISQNTNGDFNTNSKRIISQATSGDIYYFEDIKAKCPGDQQSRKMPEIYFKIR